MSSINTGSINVNYPTPGVNNNSQGFRDNFNAIKTNLDAAGTELTDLQNKVIVKSPLTGTTLNNDMNNSLISNALIQGFRHTTYNLGNNLNGAVTIDYTKGDFQYGTITGNITLSFTKWPPNGTKASIELLIGIATGSSGSTITFPNTVDNSKLTLENYTGGVSSFNITAPAGVTAVQLIISTEDCGTTLTIEPVNRPRKSAQIISGSPATTNISATGTLNAITSSATVTGTGTLFLTELVVGRVITNSSNVVVGTVASIASNTVLTLQTNAAVAVSGAAYKSAIPVGSQGDKLGTVSVDGNYLYVCTGNYDGTTAIWKRVALSSY